MPCRNCRAVRVCRLTSVPIPALMRVMLNYIAASMFGTAAVLVFRSLLRRQRDRIITESLQKYIAWSNGQAVD